MEQFVEDLADAIMDIVDIETENSSVNVDLEDLVGTKRSTGTDTARNQARNIFDIFLQYMFRTS